MTLRRFLPFLIAAVGLFAIALVPSNADLTIKARSVVTVPPNMANKQLAGAISAVMGNNTDSVVYINSKKMRFDNAFFIMLADSATGSLLMLNPANKTYIVSSLTAVSINAAGGVGALGQSSGRTVVDTGKTTTLMGHVARHYVVSLTIKFNDQATTVTQDILAAQDFAAADLDAWGKMFGKATGIEIKGIPLVSTMKMAGGLLDGITTLDEVTSLSSDPIRPAVFAIPEGYTEAAMPAPPTPPAATQTPAEGGK
ncbi:MAG: DUF4412 domain-containing protein [Capsulimonadaceae bacterium]|nr:DUF4412 domain-containing protein [Capsulimonadaceae bacterium]